VKKFAVVFAVCALAAGGAFAASFSTSGLPAGSSTPVVEGACGTVTLTQNTSQSIIALNSVSCNAGGLHADNSYFRAFDMSAYPNGFDVCEVQVGVETATGAGGQQPVTVNLYTVAAGGFPAGALTTIGSANVQIADTSASIVTVPVTGAVPGGVDLVVEVFTPDGQTAGHSFFIGSNNLGESGPSYLTAADCGVTVPTPTSAIGFPNMQIVLNAVGDETIVGGGPNPLEVPTAGFVGLAALVALLAAAGFFALRR
jgi:hypothetical protein